MAEMGAFMLTFAIAVRHQDTVSDWKGVFDRLEVTLRSIQAQDSPDWSAVIVANRGAVLPAMPDRAEVVWVDFPPPVLPAGQGEPRWRVIRRDKGGRLLAGLVHARPSGHVMVVDYDDMVSRRLARLVSDNPDANGWYLDDGYLYSGGAEAYHYRNAFHKFCGTSHIIHADILQIPARIEDAPDQLPLRWLGSHVFITEDMIARGTPIARLPFTGAVYRIGTHDSGGETPSLSTYIARRRQSGEAAPEDIRPVDAAFAAEFFGGHAA
jgi:hypothetical protein